MSMMQTRTFTVRFLTPAFLGDANQNGRWRTPPFKHLLREWWRVAWVAAGGNPGDVDGMRREEARLFGAASDGQGNRSLLRLQLERWDEGKMKQWKGDQMVHHPEVDKNKGQVGAHLYLGYGPLNYNKGTFLGKKVGKGLFKPHATIQAGEQNNLKLAFPQSDAVLIDHALALIHAFGTLGGRSRNGWGSILLEGGIEAPQLPLRDWEQCLEHEWAHAIGRDDSGALIWRTGPFSDWKELMKELAKIKIGLRTRQFSFALNTHLGDEQLYRINRRTNQREEAGIKHGAPQERHWLSYPVTNHSVKDWGNNARLPNMLRFKVQRDVDNKLYGLIFHMPHLPPRQFRPNQIAIKQVWQQVHGWLDAQSGLERYP